MGFGRGPLIAASVMAGGAALFAGWGLTQLVTSDGSFAQALQGNHAPAEASGNPQEKDAGGGSPQPPSEGGTAKQDESGTAKQEEGGTAKQDESGASPAPTPGPGDEDEDEPNGSGAPAEPAPKANPYTIEPGDTLAAISGTTGVPISILVEISKVQNQDLIYAGASLLIPRL
ncbi:LysM peptidoglycan-binding domain-containing protein [Streptomyces sp. NPDC090085]|uniref:LysM peptidoglycan-binding domain-containing protein n=1 Tax=Streptomyces sp. NPDC090085 TaxID=3365943 RepID=UPI00380913BC